MTSPYLTSITPDSLSGLIFAFEGIQNTVVIMNGPTGCKFYHSAISDDQGLRQREFDPLNYPELWYFGQPRVPCTYLDKRDYIYGSRDKLVELMEFLKIHLPFDLLVVVNSPGAALIGDDLVRIVESVFPDKPYVTVQTPGYSQTVWEGYSRACVQLAETFRRPPRRGEQKSVNLLGLCLFQKYYKGDLRELKRLLEGCGIRVNCALCSDCTLEELRALPDADLNLVIQEEYGLPAAKKLEALYDTPYFLCHGLPIGFTDTENLLRETCRLLDCDPTPMLVESEQARAKAYLHISRVNSLTGLPKGVRFAVQGTCSQCLGYARYLIRYYGMTADSVSLLNPPGGGAEESTAYGELKELLEQFGMEEALEREILQTQADLVFADANILAKLKAYHHRFCGVEIALPSYGYVDVIPKTHLGTRGALILCEQVLNGLPF